MTMSHRIKLIVVFLLLSIVAQGQMPVIIHETFDQNVYGWVEHSTSQHKVSFKNGKYVIESPAGGWMSYVAPYVDPKKNFSFEATFNQLEGDTENGFGLVWGHDGENTNSFVISSAGYFMITSGDPTIRVSEDWRETPHIKSLGKDNKLKVEHLRGTLYFYINGKIVSSTRNFKWPGKFVGFVTYTNMKLHVDDFILSHDIRINLPPSGTSVVKENLSPSVNSKFDEVSPKISADGKSLYFGRKFSPENLGGIQDKEDIWLSTSADGKSWSKAINMGAPVNTPTSNNLIAISTDNNTLLFHVSEGFAFMHRTANSWSPLENLGIKFDNESFFLEGCLSSDGKAIVFVAKLKENAFYRPNIAERDIYVCQKDESGKWSSPIHTGKTINSPGDEYSPFLSADGKTLYFASNGRPGYGDVDIFMSRRLSDSWTQWSEPVNLGLGINTVGFDAYYTIPAAGDYGYMVSNIQTLGLADIIRFKIPESVRPDPVVLIQGRVLNAKTQKPLPATIRFDDLTTGKEVGEARVDPKTGEYKIALPAGKNYGYHAAAPGFLSVNENLELKSLNEYTEVKKDLVLVPIEIGESIQLKNVFFVQSKAELKPESYPELDRLVKIMKDNPTIEIELSGHTDNRGSSQANLELSEKRVHAVEAYLLAKGVQPKRINGRGYGGSKPIAPSDTEENRQMNRRVEFKIVKK
jgi:outer membrane protein OmpA-like peptidoglycan-associated protein